MKEISSMMSQKEGKLYNENGSYYIGHFKNGMKNGKGIYYYPNGDIMYEGDYIDDEPEGNGKLVMENGNYYIGQSKKVKDTAKEKVMIKMVIFFMKGILLMNYRMVKELCILAGINMKVIWSMGNLKEMANFIIMKKIGNIQANLKMVI